MRCEQTAASNEEPAKEWSTERKRDEGESAKTRPFLSLSLSLSLCLCNKEGRNWFLTTGLKFFRNFYFHFISHFYMCVEKSLLPCHPSFLFLILYLLQVSNVSISGNKLVGCMLTGESQTICGNGAGFAF